VIALDARSGRELWSFEPEVEPAGLHAGPLTYKLGPDEPQFLVVAAGGHHRLDSPLGDWILAYALGE
jgi:quinoprotein glucose dehydrogenase